MFKYSGRGDTLRWHGDTCAGDEDACKANTSFTSIKNVQDKHTKITFSCNNLATTRRVEGNQGPIYS